MGGGQFLTPAGIALIMSLTPAPSALPRQRDVDMIPSGISKTKSVKNRKCRPATSIFIKADLNQIDDLAVFFEGPPGALRAGGGSDGCAIT